MANQNFAKTVGFRSAGHISKSSSRNRFGCIFLANYARACAKAGVDVENWKDSLPEHYKCHAIHLICITCTLVQRLI